MAGKRFIKVIPNENVTLLELLSTYVFGDMSIQKYDPNKIYNKGDLIAYINPITNRVEILQCLFDNVTGPFERDKWSESISLKNVINVMEDIDKMIIVSRYKPVDEDISKRAKLWYQCIRDLGYIEYPWDDLIKPVEPFPEPDPTLPVRLDFYGRTFPLTGDEPDNPDTKMYFDENGNLVMDASLFGEIVDGGSRAIAYDDMFPEGETFLIKRNNELHIGEDEPTDTNAVAWFKTST